MTFIQLSSANVQGRCIGSSSGSSEESPPDGKFPRLRLPNRLHGNGLVPRVSDLLNRRREVAVTWLTYKTRPSCGVYRGGGATASEAAAERGFFGHVTDIILSESITDSGANTSKVLCTHPH